MDTAFLIIVLTIMVIQTVLGWRRHARLQRKLDEHFARQSFNTPNGVVTGAALQVVRKRQRWMFLPRRSWSIWDPSPERGDAFWYCVGPGPSCFLMLPVVTQSWNQDRVQWIQRPLSETQIRVAIGGSQAVQRRLAQALEHFAGPGKQTETA